MMFCSALFDIMQRFDRAQIDTSQIGSHCDVTIIRAQISSRLTFPARLLSFITILIHLIDYEIQLGIAHLRFVRFKSTS